MSLLKMCVILGAGASYDAWNEASPPPKLEYRPPLARDLFDISSHPVYNTVLANYRYAGFIASNVAPRLINEAELGLEATLREYSEHQNDQLRKFFKHIPPYIRDVVDMTIRNYTDMPGSYIRLVTALLAEYEHEILFINMNYDTYLESALSRYDPSRFTIHRIDEYVRDDRVKIVKLHGSVNWFNPITTGLGWDEAVDRLDIFNLPGGTQIIEGATTTKAILFKENGRNYTVYPRITAPLAGKTLKEAVCPPEHVQIASDFLRDCYKFLIIGTSGLDDDLFALLNSAGMEYRFPDIHVVGNGKGPTSLTAKRFGQKVVKFRVPYRDSTFNLYTEGFKSFVGTDKFTDFLKAIPI